VNRVLLVVAHPDDEALCAGTLATLVDGGTEVSVVCTTNGGGGAGSTDLGHRALAVQRRDEMLAACAVLGISDVRFLEDPDRRAHLGRHNYAEVVADHEVAVRNVVEELRPSVVMTFGPEGVTGHQTHIMVSELTLRAVADATSAPELWLFALSDAQRDLMLGWLTAEPDVLAAYGEEVRKTPNLGAEVPVIIAVPDALLSKTVDVAHVMDRKRTALACHASQGGNGEILTVFCLSEVEHFTVRAAA
jgi:N-acetyl-1-D-myo-inositol-2-amino-2-deoxy-alpha-D-glucopyranoside deacetylase